MERWVSAEGCTPMRRGTNFHLSMLLVVFPTPAFAHGEAEVAYIFFILIGELVALVPVGLIAWLFTSGLRARLFVIIGALVGPFLVLPSGYNPWRLVEVEEISGFLTGFVLSVFAGVVMALLYLMLELLDRILRLGRHNN